MWLASDFPLHTLCALLIHYLPRTRFQPIIHRMSGGSKPGVKRGPYRSHTRERKLTDEMVRHIRQSDQSDDELYGWLLAQGVTVAYATIGRVRRRQRKAGVPD